jgi:hypothetical protein
MKQFLLKDSTQGWINGVCMTTALLTMMFAFIPSSNISIWLALTGIVSVILFLGYNVWVSDAINEE